MSWFSINLVSWPSASLSIKGSFDSFDITLGELFLWDVCQLCVFQNVVGGLMNSFLEILFSVRPSLKFKSMGNVSTQGSNLF